MVCLNNCKTRLFFCLFSFFIFLTNFISPFYVYADYNFKEEFNHEWTNPLTWTVFQNGGNISFTEQHITFSSSNKRRFPYVYSENLFPLNENLNLEFTIKFETNGYNYGSGVSVSDNLPPFPSYNHPSSQHSIISAWPLTNNQFHIETSLCPNHNPQCPENSFSIYTFTENEFYNWQNIKIELKNNQYKIFINNSLEFISAPTNRRIKHIWMGNPLRTATNVVWSSFSIDYIYTNSSISNYPIIFLPGFGGSWNMEAILSGGSSEEWKEIPIVSPYKNLKETLISAGYVENESYFEFYYDWRKRINDLADDLNKYINNNISSEEKVNLVGHSMGGLVARAYGNKYGDEKINKIITVGTPHKGILGSYYAWEGGHTNDQVSLLWLLTQLGLEVSRKNFHTPKDTIQATYPSIQDLLPVFSFLKNADGSIKDVNSMVEQNDYLKNLNDSGSLKEKIVTLSGKEDDFDKDTPEYYIVENRTILDKLLGFWIDGLPVNKEHTSEGDLTVLTKSALVSDFLSEKEVTGKHISIIENEEGLQTILDALEISGVTPDTSHSSPFTIPFLAFILGSPANIKITDPNNNQAGYGIVSPGSNTYYSEENKLIFISSAPSGEYSVELTGTDTGTYHLYIGQLGKSESQWQTIKGKIHPSEILNFTLSLDLENPKKGLLKDETGGTFLSLAQQRLEKLNDYIANNVSHRSTKKRLQYSISRTLRRLSRSFKYLNRQKHYLASRYVFSSFINCHRLRININQYLKRNLLVSEQSIYIKNELEAVIELLSSSWVELYQNSGKSITSSKILRYQRALKRIFTGLEPQIETKAQQGENKDLGVAFSLVEKTQEKGNQYLEENYLEEAYINYVSTRMFLLENLRLLR